MIRIGAIIVGLLGLAATMHMNVHHVGGYEAPAALGIMVVAAITAFCAIAVGEAWRRGQWQICAAMILVLILGEVAGVLATKERVVAARGDASAPLVEKQRVRSAAEARLTSADSALQGFSGTSPRLQQALASKTAADRAVVEKAAEKGCAANCRLLLEQAATSAATEVTAARRELDEEHARLRRDLAGARDALAKVPVHRAVEAAANVTIAGWSFTYDEIVAILHSLLMNGGSAVVLAFGAHSAAAHRKPGSAAVGTHVAAISRAPVVDVEPIATPLRPSAQPLSKVAPPPASQVTGSVHQFAAAVLHPKPKGRLKLAEAHTAYVRWCRNAGCQPLEPGDFADEFARIVRSLALPVQNSKSGPVILGAMVVPIQIEHAAA